MTELMRRRRALMGANGGEDFPEQEIGVNLIDTTTVTLDYSLDLTTGNITYDSNARVTDYIPVNPTYTYSFQKPHNRYANVCWYDKNKTFIEGSQVLNSANPGQRKTPPNAARYVRFSANKTGAGGTTTFVVARAS